MEKKIVTKKSSVPRTNNDSVQDKPKRKYTKRTKVKNEDESNSLLNINSIDTNNDSLLTDEYTAPNDEQILSDDQSIADAVLAVNSEEEQQHIIDEHNRRVMKSPEFQAEYMYQNYIQNCGRILDGQTKRRIRKQFLRDAKKGRLNKYFDEEKIAQRRQREQEKFDRLNAPVVHTVDDIPEDTQETLKKMAEMEYVKKD